MHENMKVQETLKLRKSKLTLITVVYNAILNYLSAMSLRSALLAEEIGKTGEKLLPFLVTDKNFPIKLIHYTSTGEINLVYHRGNTH